jgi:hypothetical protein
MAMAAPLDWPMIANDGAPAMSAMASAGQARRAGPGHCYPVWVTNPWW